MNGNSKTLALFVLAAIAIYLLLGQNKSGYSLGQEPGSDVSSSLDSNMIPREVSTDEDFGTFSPDSVLSNQNFLDPRQQIGFPETIGGNLRNANLQERSEPPNPRSPVSIRNVSTIPPDLMRPGFEIGARV
jgi:hypothetical protein